MQTHRNNELADGLHHYLTGYGRNDPAKLDLLLNFDRWQDFARTELTRRAQEVIAQLDAPTLQAIANGEIKVEDAVRRAREGLQRA